MLAELLLLARVDAGAAEGRRERRFLDDLVLDTLAPWRPLATEAGVTLATSRVEEAPAQVEPALVERLVGILVDNAIRYTPRGGRVDVRTFAEGGRAVLEVEDTGIGIAPAERDRVFERFYRGTAARTAAPEGSGLGLSIAQWIVARHDGTIELRERSGGGTVVRVAIEGGGNG
jgi:signal transduction histidine kinase